MSAAKRLETLRQFLESAHQRLALGFGFVLWDGSRVPTNYPHDGPAIAFADEGVITSLIRGPNLDTLAQLWVSARLDIRNGTLFDIAERRPKVRTKKLARQIDWKKALGVGWQFLFVPRGGPWPLAAQVDKRPSDGTEEENRENVSYHYDVSNAFYALWLDKEMVYSCGYCTDWNNDLDQMQQDKLEIICRKLRLKQGEQLFDVGCGWGALLCYAAEHYGAIGYGVTLSEQQRAYAQEKINRLGLNDRVKIELKDYSKVEGTFDKVASIGSQEHIGIANHSQYYRTIHRLLKPGGLVLNHAITRPAKRDRRAFRRKRAEAALITKYIFPGGELDHIGDTVAMLERHGFEVHDVEDWREHYQRTCKHWHDRLLANYDAALREVGAVKTRMWLAYLAGCSMSFARNGLCVYQTLASKRQRGPSGLPPTRADLYLQPGKS